MIEPYRMIGGPAQIDGATTQLRTSHVGVNENSAAGVTRHIYQLDTSVTPPVYRFVETVPPSGEWPPRNRAVDEALDRAALTTPEAG